MTRVLPALLAALTLACASPGLTPSYHGPNGNGVLSPWLPTEQELALPAGTAEVASGVRSQVLDLLAEYEAAYQARDIDRLSRVWVMDAYERFVMAGLFRSYERLAMSVQPGSVLASGDTVLVDFDQRTARLSGSSGKAQLRASLAQRASGEWVVYEVRERPAGPAVTQEQVDRGAFTAAREFRAAFQDKDLERLSAVWLMSEGERETMEQVFARAPHTRFEIDVVGISSSGRHATMDFDQRFVSRTRQPTESGTDHLRAQLARDDDGGWKIFRLFSRGH